MSGVNWYNIYAKNIEIAYVSHPGLDDIKKRNWWTTSNHFFIEIPTHTLSYSVYKYHKSNEIIMMYIEG